MAIRAGRVFETSKIGDELQRAGDLVDLAPVGHAGEGLRAVIAEERAGVLLEKRGQSFAVRHGGSA